MMLPCGEGARNLRCVEVGTTKCPCFLAMIKRCPVCTYLSGEGLCDCQWTGVCILLESKWFHDEERRMAGIVAGEVSGLKYLGPGAVHIRVHSMTPAPSGLCKPGVFFHLADPLPRPSIAPSFICNEPGDDSGELELVATFPPSAGRTLLSLEGRKLKFLGPFTATVIGEGALVGLSGGTALLVGEGFFQGSMVLVARRLREKGNRVGAIIAGGRARRPYILELLRREGIHTFWAGNSIEGAFGKMEEVVRSGGIDLIFSCGSFLHHARVISLLKGMGRDEITPVFLSPSM